MKFFSKLLTTVLFGTVMVQTLSAQSVTVSGAVTGNGSYNTLAEAFTAIGTVQTGANIAIDIAANITEPTTATLGAGDWASLAIKPSGGSWTIDGNIAGPLIDLNGADNVTIDGLNTGGNALTISNMATSGSSAIRFMADASNNTVQNCTLKGSASTASNAVVLFGTGTITGNDGNSINNCVITAAGSNLPVNAVFSQGTSAAIDNSGNTLNANSISDYFSATLLSTGINLAATGNTGWTITNNKLFQTATRVYTVAQTHNGIYVGVGAGYTITGNTIGFANAAGTGTTNMVGLTTGSLGGTFPGSYTTGGTANATRYIAINCAFTASGAASSIQDNTIAGFALYTSSGATTTNGIFCGINITSGNANIGTVTGNTIGAATGQGSIYTACTTSGGTAVGIYATSTNTVTISNNTIGAMDASGTSATTAGGFTGIDVAGALGVVTISNNTIGNSTADNIRTGFMQSGTNLSNTGTLTSTTGGTAQMMGIRNAATGVSSITGNTFRGLAIGGTTTVCTGIAITGAVTTSNTITGNFLGTATLGWVRFAFNNAGTLTGISVASTAAAAPLTITGNDIRGIVHSTVGSSSHTYITWAHSSSTTDNINSNTFTNLDVNTSGSVTFLSRGASMNATGVENVNSNAIVTAFNKGAANGSITFFNGAGTSVQGSTMTNNGNNFSNITITGSTVISGWSNAASGPTKTITNNTFNNITANATPTGTITILTVNGSGPGSVVSSNTISNISGGGTIIGMSLGTNNQSITVSQNQISSMTNAGASPSVTGISSISTAVAITKNKLYDLNATGTGAAVVTGIGITNTTASSAVTISNNLIGNLTAPTSTSSNGIMGISITNTAATSSYNVYYNTIYLNNTTSGAGFGSSGISVSANATATSSTLNLRNNIIVNKSVQNAAGRTVAYRRSTGTAGTLANYASTSNNNLFYAGTPSATNLIYYDGTSSAQTIADYRNGVFTAGTIALRDAASITENPSFLSTTGSDADFLHINAAVTTQLESAGASVSGTTDDYDGDTRNASTPDIGADEFGGTGTDLTAPAISYTALGTTTVGTNQTLTATIIDQTGVGTGAGLPTLYYKVNAGAYSAVTGVSIGSNQYTFTFGAAATTPNDVVSYYVVAQDAAGTPNIGVFPYAGATGFSSNPPAVSTAPTTPSTYTVMGAISGTKTVGTGGDYTTITAAIADLNTKMLNGPLTLSLTNTAYTGSETFPITINANLGNSASNTVTIKPTQASTTITGSSGTAIFVINGADYVTIDGSTGSTVNSVCPASAASRDLTITNTNTGGTAVVWVQTTALADGANYNTVKNCNIVGGGSTTTHAAIGSGGTTIGSAPVASATGNSNNQYINNNISKALHGIWSFGSGTNTGTVINQNLINTASPNNILRIGIYVGTEDLVTVSGNTITNISGATGANVAAISLGLNVPATNGITNNQVTNATVTKNNIGSIRAAPASNAGVAGIIVSSTTTGTNLIANNMIADAFTNGTSNAIGAGIFIGTVTGGGSAKVYSNTINMASTMTGAANSNFGIAINGSNGVVDLRNNIVSNTGSNGFNGNRALGIGYSTITNLTSNNNNFFASGTGSAAVQIGSLANTGYNAYTTVAGWNGASGKDANSKNVLPVFMSSTNLHIDNSNASNNTNFNNTGAAVTEVTDDIDCAPRGSFHDMGADQFSIAGVWTGTTSTDYEVATNWFSNAVPSSALNVTIPTGVTNMPVLSTNRTVNGLALQAGATLGLGGQTLTINGGVSGTGTLTGSSTSNLVIGGTAGTLNFTPGSSILKDLTLNASTTATLGSALGITAGTVPGTVNIGAGAVLTTGGFLTLKSDADGTARIAALTTGSIAGNITQERYITAKPARTYDFVASPFIQSINSAWQQQVHITGPGTGGTVCPALTAHSNGFDATVSNAASMFVYDGTKTTGSRWASVAGTNAVNLTPGIGYRMNIRGPRTIGCSLLDGTVSAVTTATLSSTGTLSNANKNMGSFTVTVPNNGDATIANDNYLLTGNPYPSQISFAALRAANSTVINNAYAIYAPGNTVGNYAFWNGSTFTGGNTGVSDITGDIIANGQAFFIQGSVGGAGVTLNWEETMKTDALSSGYFRQLNPNHLRIGYMLANGNKADEIMVQFAANASNDRMNSEDVVSINAGTQYLKSLKAGNGLAFNTRNSNFTKDTVKLNVVSSTSGNFKLSFYDFDEFVKATGTSIYLLDNYTNTMQLMNDNKEYPFEVTNSIPATQGTERFAVVFSRQPVITTPLITVGIKAYPNPVVDQLTVELPEISTGSYGIKIMDITGKAVVEKYAQRTSTINMAKLASGTYILEITDTKGQKSIQKIVKQ